MVVALQYPQVHDKLRSLALAGPYHPSAHGPTGLVTVDMQTAVQPSSVVVLEDRATFGLARRDRTGDTDRERYDWWWRVEVHFDREVTAEAFERAVSDKRPSLPASAADDLRPAWFHLEETEVDHPMRKNKRVGTTLKFKFNVQIGPR